MDRGSKTAFVMGRGLAVAQSTAISPLASRESSMLLMKVLLGQTSAWHNGEKKHHGIVLRTAPFSKIVLPPYIMNLTRRCYGEAAWNVNRMEPSACCLTQPPIPDVNVSGSFDGNCLEHSKWTLNSARWQRSAYGSLLN